MTTDTLHEARHLENELRTAKDRFQRDLDTTRMALAGLVNATDVIRDLELRVSPGNERRELLDDFRGGVARSSKVGVVSVAPRELVDPTEDRKLLQRHKYKLSHDLEVLELKLVRTTDVVRTLERQHGEAA